MSIGDELPPLRRPGGPVKSSKKKGLRDVAVFQKVILVCLLIQILLIVGQFMVQPGARPVIAVTSLVLGVVQAVFIFRLSIKLYSQGLGIVLGILALIPCIGLIVLLVVNAKATGVLRASGHSVGFMGANLAEFPAPR